MAEKKSDKAQNFEKALERLETIVGEMEAGTLSLEKMMACFEEGTELVKFCTQKLNEVEKKIEILAKKGDEIVAEPFDPSEDKS
jgi:exodeoxyribonuclease VII small subunit